MSESTDGSDFEAREGGEHEASAEGLGLILLDEWMAAHEGLVAGTTVRPTDYGLKSPSDTWEASERFEALGRVLGFRTVAVARQVHGSTVQLLRGAGQQGFQVCGEADGLASDRHDLLMTVTVADCVPVFMVDPGAGAAAVLHAGWRGAAEGVLANGLESLARLAGSSPADLLVHLGPAICGTCYEVGPEVLSRFGLPSDRPGTLDLRSWLAREARGLGVPRSAITRSPSCTACDPARLHSHRGSNGTAGRMVAFIGHLRRSAR
ncbi:MAG: polyphenol oxidase family protein [marine benthic group bacterium]|jgi:YfiH family protein|nr:polyphenol oxidase family protein [Gemmatimonadota bacterium]MCL7985177.1 polyphenol oxidase family protein [Gemmatimonadota bacterium]